MPFDGRSACHAMIAIRTGSGVTLRFMSLSEPKTRLVDERRVSFHRTAERGGVPILLLHGGGLDRASLSWRHLFPALAASGRDVIAPDWPGYGDSEGLGRDHTLGDLGAWLLAFLDELHVERVDAVGVSMGGGAALWLALEHPGRVRRIVAADAYGLQDRAPFHGLSYLLTRLPFGAWSGILMRRSRWAVRRALGSIFADPDRIDDALIDEMLDVLRGGTGLATFGRFQRGEVGPRRLRTVLFSRLDRVRAPVLIVHGERDTLVPLANARAAAERMPNARLVTLDAGHWPMRECPERFNQIVASFLERTEPFT